MYARARYPSAEIAAAVCAVLGTLPICAPLAFIGAPAAVAQTAEAGALPADIPAQPLAQALAAFASQTGLQLVYVSEVVQNKKSRPAAAGLSAEQALTRMLRGTGLQFEYLTPHSIRILAAEPSPRSTSTSPANDDLSEVIVTASRRDEHLLNVPITIEVLTGETHAKLNATMRLCVSNPCHREVLSTNSSSDHTRALSRWTMCKPQYISSVLWMGLL